jgi:hypothetical protein
MVTGEPVNVSEGSHRWLLLESWAQCVMGEIVGFSPTSEINGGERKVGAFLTHHASLLGLVRPRACCCGLRWT